MYVIIIGAEKEGQYIADIASSHKHELTLITTSEDKARKVLENTNIRVLVGSVADGDILNEAEIERADAVIATTYDDAQNLMAIYMAKEYKVGILVSLVNYQSHSSIFQRLNAQVVSEPARVVANQLYSFIDQD